MDLTEANKIKIQANRREIFELETSVNSNKQMVYSTRATIDQNYSSIMRNYSSAFLSNHNLTTQNTDSLFRNRVAILTNMEVEGEVEINFRESMTNEANLDFLEMQATVKANKDRADSNKKRCAEIRSLSTKNTKRLRVLDDKAKKNSMQVLFNAAEISKRRDLISENQKQMIENQEEVARMIASRIKGKQ